MDKETVYNWIYWTLDTSVRSLKENEAQSAHVESTHKEVN